MSYINFGGSVINVSGYNYDFLSKEFGFNKGLHDLIEEIFGECDENDNGEVLSEFMDIRLVNGLQVQVNKSHLNDCYYVGVKDTRKAASNDFENDLTEQVRASQDLYCAEYGSIECYDDDVCRIIAWAIDYRKIEPPLPKARKFTERFLNDNTWLRPNIN